MELSEMIERIGPFVAIPAILGFFLLLPLYLSQRRDIARLRAWMEREPAHPAADLRASEARLDRAETELRRLLGNDEETLAETVVRPPPAATPAAARVTGERPALARITVERAALDPHPRWRRFTRRMTQPWVLLAIAAIAIVAGAGAILASERLLSVGSGDGAPAESFDPSEITVSVLNGTAAAGLAGRVQSDVAANGYQIDTVGTSLSKAERTGIQFRQGHRIAALRVASDLGIRERRVEPIDAEIRRIAGGAEVVVIAGEDRVR